VDFNILLELDQLVKTFSSLGKQRDQPFVWACFMQLGKNVPEN